MENICIFFALMILILIFANLAKPDEIYGIWFILYNLKWYITTIIGIIFGIILIFWYGDSKFKLLLVSILTILSIFTFDNPSFPFLIAILGISYVTLTGNDELKSWFDSSWSFAKQITPLLFIGVLIAGFLLGRPGNEGIIPSVWINNLVGGNSLLSNFIASVVGAFMYFATLTEIPIVQGLMGSGMGKGPALALLLAGPALSLPSILVIKSVIGWQKSIVYVSLVIVFSTLIGYFFGII